MLCSHCEEHPWKLRSFNPDKRSIFALEEEEEGGEQLCYAYSQQEEGEEVIKGQVPLTQEVTEIDNSTSVTCSEQPPETRAENSASKENGVTPTGQARVRHSEQLCAGDTGCPTVKSKTYTTAGKLASIKGRSSKTYVVCGGNAAPL